jgi:hypothetical protein
MEFGKSPTLIVLMPADAAGYVGFYDTDQPGSGKGIGTAHIVDGVATLTTPTKSLPAGTLVIHASYGRDAVYEPNHSNAVTVMVVAP